MKKVLIHTDFSLSNTGFGRNALIILKYLFSLKKYEIIHFSAGMIEGDPKLERTPWKSIGSIPKDYDLIEKAKKDPGLMQQITYGQLTVNNVIEQEKPDVYIGIQDWWGLNFCIKTNWFQKLNSVLWTTLDSLPLIPQSIECGHLIKNYWIWSDFATKELHKHGINHVKTVHGAFQTDNFYKLSCGEKQELRARFGIDKDDFIIGFVFRNQLRKSVPNLLEGYALWKKQNPLIKNTKLLFHTHFGEGWDIKRQCELKGVNPKEVLTTYVCQRCNSYEVKSFDDRVSRYKVDAAGNPLIDEKTKQLQEHPLDIQEKDCKFCGTKKSQITSNVGLGVSIKELNEIYNLMDVYIHPFTSGGQEMPIQEAKLTELITLVTNYSCGEEMNYVEAASLPLDYSEYTEHGSEFIKASTSPVSIARQLNKVYNMDERKRAEMGKKAREWVIKGFDIEVVGAEIAKFIDDSPEIDKNNKENFNTDSIVRDPGAIIANIVDNREWILELYRKILGRSDIDSNDKGVQDWMKQLEVDSSKRPVIEDYFRDTARKEEGSRAGGNELNLHRQLEELFKSKDNKKKVLMLMPRSLGDCIILTSLFEDLRERYPANSWEIIIATEESYREVFLGNSYIDRWIQYNPIFENVDLMEGRAENKGFVDILYMPHEATQRGHMNYKHNGLDVTHLDINTNYDLPESDGN